MKKLASFATVLLAGVVVAGCYRPAWPLNPTVSAPEKELRYMAQALRLADVQCAEGTSDEAELMRCERQYHEIKALLVTLGKE